jgi:DNA-binding NarL/FixJ family response regulator
VSAPRVVIADDHAPTRAEVARALTTDGFDVVAAVGDAPSAVEAAVRLRPDACLLDLNMPGSGLGALWEIHRRLPRCKAVVLTIYTDDRHLFPALRAGADGYLVKEMDPGRLGHALRRVLDGEAALPRALVGRVVEEFRDRQAHRRALADDGPAAQLTSREWQVLDLLRKQLTTNEIAERLVLSPVTVRTHIHAILRKLRFSTREELFEAFRNS